MSASFHRCARVVHGLTALLASAGVGSVQEAPASPRLVAGPMAAVAGVSTAALWMQTSVPAEVSLRYWPRGRPDEAQSSVAGRTDLDGDLIALLRLSDLVPDTTYDYRVWLDGVPAVPPGRQPAGDAPALSFSTEAALPALSEITLAFGSCAYFNDAGQTYGGGYEIFDAIADARPDLMLWLGDNVYLREGEWDDPARMRSRYRTSRAEPALQRLLQEVEQVAIWDDHDFGPDDCDASFPHKQEGLAIFGDYWPDAAALPGPGNARRLRLADIELFLLDDRSFRSPDDAPDGPDKTMFGPQQFGWLLEGLRSSTATWKLVANGNQVVNPVVRFEALGLYPTEQRALYAALRADRVEGVVFLTGDRHAAELLVHRPEGGYPWYDFTSSPLTSGPADLSAEAENPARVPGTWVHGARNFGLVTVTGASCERRLVLSCHDQQGSERWRHEIHERELRFPPSGGS